MLKFFVESVDLPESKAILRKLDEIKHTIIECSNDRIFPDLQIDIDCCADLFDAIQNKAVDEHNEKISNAQYLFHQYFHLFIDLYEYFKQLNNKHFSTSWDKLQDCLDEIKYICRFTEERYDLPLLVDLLTSYETLYPYSLFISGEYVVSKSHCSICGKSMLDLSCPHIAGNIYWGEQAIEVIDDIKEVKAISLVQHPRDKRCVITLADDKRSEEEQFKKLSMFLDLKLPYLQLFSIERRLETRQRDDIVKVGMNAPCSCGSGKKFKKCCRNNLFYKHDRLIVDKRELVALRFFST